MNKYKQVNGQKLYYREIHLELSALILNSSLKNQNSLHTVAEIVNILTPSTSVWTTLVRKLILIIDLYVNRLLLVAMIFNFILFPIKALVWYIVETLFV